MAIELPRSAVAVIHDSSQYLLEDRPNLPGHLANPGMLSLVGGGLEKGEQPMDGMLREMREELIVPRGIPGGLQRIEKVWDDPVEGTDGITRHVWLFVAQLACRVSDVRPHPDLLAKGTKLAAFPLDTFPRDMDRVTTFTLRALTAHTTRMYEHV